MKPFTSSLRSSQPESADSSFVSMSSPPGTTQFRQRTNGFPRGVGDLCQRMDEESLDRVKVGVRIRPFNMADGDDHTVALCVDKNNVFPMTAKHERLQRSYAFDHVFTSGQEEVYNTIGLPMLRHLLDGYNVCLFAYGQTGSGKTYSMLGEGSDIGIAPRICSQLMQKVQERLDEHPNLSVKITMSYIEIYNEKVRDLLEKVPKGAEPTSLSVYERDGRIVVSGLSTHSVINYDKIEQLIRYGNLQRQTCTTNMNETSSRSHSILQFSVSQTYEPCEPGCRDVESTLTLVDLAGSERISKSEISGVHFEESKKINQSLLCLGRALNYFSTNHTGNKVPFLRSSKLTRLLSDCFGGNSLTWMLATVSPSTYNLTETLSTLEYAQYAKMIKNNARINSVERAIEIKALQEKVRMLNEQIDQILADKQTQIEEQAQILFEEWTHQKQDQWMNAQREKTDLTQQVEQLKAENKKLHEAACLEDSQTIETLQVTLTDALKKLERMDHSNRHLKEKNKLLKGESLRLNEELQKAKLEESRHMDEQIRLTSLLEKYRTAGQITRQKMDIVSNEFEKWLLSDTMECFQTTMSSKASVRLDTHKALHEKLLEFSQMISSASDSLSVMFDSQQQEFSKSMLKKKEEMFHQRNNLQMAAVTLCDELSSSKDEVFKHIETALKADARQLREMNSVLLRLLKEQQVTHASETEQLQQALRQLTEERDQLRLELGLEPAEGEIKELEPPPSYQQFLTYQDITKDATVQQQYRIENPALNKDAEVQDPKNDNPAGGRNSSEDDLGPSMSETFPQDPPQSHYAAFLQRQQYGSKARVQPSNSAADPAAAPPAYHYSSSEMF